MYYPILPPLILPSRCNLPLLPFLPGCSCLLRYTVALPGYAHEEPMPVLALWRLACTAIGLVIELLAALIVFPVTARSAAHAVAAGALRGMADVADIAFRSVLPPGSANPAANRSAREGSRRSSRDSSWRGSKSPPLSRQASQQPGLTSPTPHSPLPSQQQEPKQEATKQPQQGQGQGQGQGQEGQPPHISVALPGSSGWQGSEVAPGAVLSRIYQPVMDTYGRITTLRSLLVPLR